MPAERPGYVAALADARIAASDDDEVAAQHALVNRSHCDDLRLELMLPSEQFGSRRHRDELHHRAGHHEFCCVQRIQIVAALSGRDEHAPEGPLELRC